MNDPESVSILLVEDDMNLGALLCEYLIAKGFDAELATDGQQGYDRFGEKDFDLCILDVMMPVKDGFTLAREIRETDRETPIIFLTAKSMKEDTIEGFKSGGDDYLPKPFSMEELLYRIKAIVRRSSGGQHQEKMTFEIGKIQFNSIQQQLTLDDQVVKLTSKENQLLRLLCQNSNHVLSREAALKRIWGEDTYFNARSMDVYVSKLRKHLKLDPDVEIVNVHGKGFKLIAKI